MRGMKTPALFPVLVPGLFLTLLVMAAAVAQPRQPEPSTQIVVLRNGNVLEGQVDELPDTIRVLTATSEIRLPVRDVERLAPSLLGAYDAKRAEVRQGSAGDHLELAAWCVRQELWPQAARELNDATAIDSSHRLIPVIERRLQVAVRAAQRASQRPVAEISQSDEESDLQRAEEIAELEALVSSLPPGTLESFARQVQPILVNGCAAASCHGPNAAPYDHDIVRAQAFLLNRDSLRGVGTRESTLRNLKAVWEAINHQNPAYSPLLTQPSVPHGGLPHAVFAGSRQRLQQTLREWVLTAAAPMQPLAEPTSEQVELAAHEVPSYYDAGMPAIKAAEQTNADNAVKHFWEIDDQQGEAGEPQVRYGVKIKPYKPRDEFDPELFNRRQAMTAESDEEGDGEDSSEQ